MKLEKVFLIGILLLASFLRLYNVSTIPPGLYIDEVAIGQNAYTILTEGKDEHGVSYPIWFRSFGDYKMPVYIYAVSGSMILFGKNEFAVRFPSIIAGILAVVVVYFLLKKLLSLDVSFKFPYLKLLPLLTALLLSLSSWHVHFSRGGFEVNLALTIFLSGVLLAVMYMKYRAQYFLFLAIALFIVSMYTYHSFRIIAPLFVMIMLIFMHRNKIVSSLKLFLTASFFLLLILPIVQFSLTSEGSERFSQTSAFSEYPVKTVGEKILVYPMVYLKDYLSFFSLHYLFNFGDGIGRHQMADFGLLYRWQLPFLFIGAFVLLKKYKTSVVIFMIVLLCISIVPAALSRPSPHSLRPLLMVLPLMFLIATGILATTTYFKSRRKLVISVIAFFALCEMIYCAHFYLVHYPKVNLLDWGAGYKEVVQESDRIKDGYSAIVIDKALLGGKLYFDFYDSDVQYTFVASSWKKPKELTGKKVLYIRPYYGQRENPMIIKNIVFPNVNKDIFAQFWEL